MPNPLEEKLKKYIENKYRELFKYRQPGATSFDCKLHYRIIPGDSGIVVEFEPSLAGQVKQTLSDLASQSGGFRAGRVFCYFCERADCSHGEPPDSEHIFLGYRANGIPRWQTFHQYLLDTRDAGAHALFGEHPELLARFFHGRQLKESLMHGFGKASKTYDILSQVAVGYMNISTETHSLRSLALTLQAVESRSPDGGFHLQLNVIGNTGTQEAIMDILSVSRYDWLYKEIRNIRRTFSNIERIIRRSPGNERSRKKREMLKHVPHVMKNMLRVVTHYNRQRGRRTRHAHQRRIESRPVHAATSDILEAGRNDFFWDEKKQTMVIRGPKKRIHVFAREGIHITSLQLQADQVQRRMKTGRWRPASDSEFSEFLDNFHALVRE